MKPESGRPPLRVVVAGLGHVGRETARLLWTRAKDYAAAGAPVRLVAVCDRSAALEARRLGLPASVRRLKDFRGIPGDSGIDAVVELFGGDGPARRLVLESLARGKDVVTANKLLVSTRWRELFSAADKTGRRVYFEAAVAGGIPIVQALREGLAADRIHRAYGIFNGTTNFILSRMAHDGCGMKEALREARRLGMAEKDPALDLNGSDTMHKVAIVASLLAGLWVPPAKVPRTGIERIEAEDIRYAVDRLACTVRLIGTAVLRKAGPVPAVEAHVQPTLVPLDHPLAGVHGGYNAVLVQASSAEDLMFYGKGAGPGPAASAVTGDVLALARGRGTGARQAAPARGSAVFVEESEAPFYLKLRVGDVPGALSKITGVLGRHRISIARIHQPAERGAGKSVPVMITTHATSRSRMDAARAAVARLPMVARGHTCLRFLPL